MNIIIRSEQTQDFKRVEEVARDAFWNLYFPGANEHKVVNKIRSHKDFIKDLSFVIEVDGIVQGAIFYTNSKIIQKDTSEIIDTISFGPVFISPELHRIGLGKKLITHSIEIAKSKGYRGILTLGYKYHYEPYGFLSGKKYNISQSDGKFYKGLLVLPLYAGAFDDIYGYVLFSDALEVTQYEVDKFEENFPIREKKFEKSQEEFEKACIALDE